jgi:hypothetical protein
VDLPEYGFVLGVLHIRAAGSGRAHPTNMAKAHFWDAVLRAAEARVNEPFLLVGDWNTGANRLVEKGKTYFFAEHFQKLSAMGWTRTQSGTRGFGIIPSSPWKSVDGMIAVQS